MKTIVALSAYFLLAISAFAQPSEWNAEKPGAWRFQNYFPEKDIKVSAAENLRFKKNLTQLAEWFHQNHSMLQKPKAYDLRCIANTGYAGYSKKQIVENNIPGTIDFLFELFDAEGGKWTVEPPQANMGVNAIWGGIDGFFYTPESIVDDGSRWPLSQSAKVNAALDELRKYFRVYPLKEQPCAGMDIYEAYRDGWQANGRQAVVVYNPERPPYWLPVTVQEMADAYEAYLSLINLKEIDRMVYDQLKKEIAELSPDELAAPAYAGRGSAIAFQVNGQGHGYQIMRFNPAYWDSALPKSSIQLLTFRADNLTASEMAEQAQRSYPHYPQMFYNNINWKEVAVLLHRN